MESESNKVESSNNNNRNKCNQLGRRRCQAYPPLLPLPPVLHHLPPPPPTHHGDLLLLQMQRSQQAYIISNTCFLKLKRPTSTTSSSFEAQVAHLPMPQSQSIGLLRQNAKPRKEGTTKKATFQDCKLKPLSTPQAIVTAQRPDPGGCEGPQVPLLANHFLVQFDPSQKIFHYNVDISPHPSKEIARLIKDKLVQDNADILSGPIPVFDGRKNLYSAVEFQDDRLEFFISLPIPTIKSSPLADKNSAFSAQNPKLFRVNIRLASKLNGENLSKYLNELENGVPLPQDYLQALDVVLRESSTESCLQLGRCLYSASMGGGVKGIGGGAVGMRGFFQSLRPTQQGLALNVDFSVMAFYESIGVIPYLQKRCNFLKDLSQRKTRVLTIEEKREVEKVLKNIRVFVRHRETNQRYHVFSLTDETTENLKFRDRDGRELLLVKYFKDHYSHDIQFRNLPCLQISRSKPCYLPMELCVICEGQKFLGKLSDDQTARILKMGCQRPGERKDTINGIINGTVGPTSGCYPKEFNLQISREMTQLTGRVLQPPKLRFGDGGSIREITPTRHDRQWNLLSSHVAEGSQINRWALISFGVGLDQRTSVTRFINQLSNRCEQLGISLNKNTVISPSFEPIQMLNNVAQLESKLRKIHDAPSCKLQLLICVMERKHKGYADLKRIAETSIGVVSQCCLYNNISKPSTQFLSNIALKINAKLGGCNVMLYNTLPRQIPRLFADDEPVIFMGADVTHPHPLDDSTPSVAAVVGSINWPAASKYITRMRSQTHRQEMIEELEDMSAEIFEEFSASVGKLASRIIFFRDGVSETQFHKVLKEELRAIRSACSRFKSYQPKITFAVVQKRHHTRLFLNERKLAPTGHQFSSEDNIPPGTVVDTVITHPREFDFYLCSHWGTRGTSKPTHYHVLWDENDFRSDELQKLIHNLCYTFVRCTKPVSLVPPAYYAHLAAYRGRLYIERSVAMEFRGTTTLSRAARPLTLPLPKLRDDIKKLMFYC